MRIKICGITTAADGRQAGLLGADAVGLNFYPRSRRFVEAGTAAAVLRELPPYVEAVGVFVNLPFDQVAEQMRSLGSIASVQWHGDEHVPPTRWPYRFIPAFPVRDRDSLPAIDRYLDLCQGQGVLPTAVLVDAHVAGEYGGTGRTAPWELLAEFHPDVPVVLAGGLTPDNVAEAIRRVRPYAVDVAGGVESSPGRKDPEKMRRFIDAARAAAAGL